jgi:3-oxoadipate enol-lactonase
VRIDIVGAMKVTAALACASVLGTAAAVPGLHVDATGSGPAVVLVHAFHMDLRQWDEQLPALRAHRVVRYDVRGHGKSEPPAEGYAAHEDLAAVLRDAGAPRASIVGHSMGGQIAVDFALAHPDMVDRLVLVSPGISGFNPGPPGDWFKPIIDAVRAGDATRAGELWWDSPLMAGVKARGKEGEPYRRIVLDNARIWTLPRRADAPLGPPAVNRLKELEARTLIVIGERDEPALRDLARRIAAEMPNARVEEMKGVGHMAPLERPAEFNRLLSGFLR